MINPNTIVLAFEMLRIVPQSITSNCFTPVA